MTTSARGRLARRLGRVTAERAHVLAGLLLAFMACILAVGIFADSPVVDEPNHITRGVAYLATGDPRMSHPHPPLANLLQGLPGWLRGGAPDFTASDGWATSEPAAVARTYLSSDYERARSAIVSGRAVTAAMTLLLGLYLYVYCQRFGRRVALFCLLLFTTQPMLSAHGHLVTTDLPVTFAVFVTLGETTKLVTRRGWGRVAAVGLALGAAMSAKYSGLFFGAVVAASLVYAAALGTDRYRGRPAFARFLGAARDLAIVVVIAVLVVNAAYAFNRTGWSVGRIFAEPEPKHWVEKRAAAEQFLEHSSLLRHLPAWVPVPLPYTYVFGLSAVGNQTEEGGHGGYFFGYHGVTPAYFPVMLLLKATGAAVVVAGLALSRKWRLQRPRPTTFVFGTASLVFLAVAMASHLNIGIRHVLPIVPPLIVLVRSGLARVLLIRRLALRRAFLGALVVGSVVEAAVAAPHQLGHFDALVGGAPVGHLVTMVGEDWAQDVGDAARYLRARGATTVRYNHYGQASDDEFRRNGIEPVRWQCDDRLAGPGFVVEHEAREVRRKRCPALESVPRTVIDHHIVVYELPPATP